MWFTHLELKGSTDGPKMNKKILEIRPEKINNVPKGDEKLEYGGFPGGSVVTTKVIAILDCAF